MQLSEWLAPAEDLRNVRAEHEEWWDPSRRPLASPERVQFPFKSEDDEAAEDPPQPSFKFGVRDAPSLVTRADAQIAGVSAPRLSKRMYLTADGTVFFNLRKRRYLRQAAEVYSVERCETPSQRHPCYLPAGDDRIHLQKLVALSPVFADAVLRKPKRIDRYYVLSVSLGSEYGEDFAFSGTPYVQPFHIAGGCVQSVLQMANILMSKYSDCVSGVGEISAMCSDWDLVSEHRIDFLGDSEISRFAAEVDLYVHRQRAVANCGPREEPVERFFRSIDAYLRSSIPVIVPVDLERLYGVGLENEDSDGGSGGKVMNFCDEESRRLARQVFSYTDTNHTVLVVGSDGSGNFVIHDPTSRPFIEISAEQLYNAGSYRGKESSEVDKGVFTPVVPKSVRMSLNFYSHTPPPKPGVPSGGKASLVDGAADLAFALGLDRKVLDPSCNKWFSSEDILPVCHIMTEQFTWRLCRSSEIAGIISEEDICINPLQFCESVEQFVAEANGRGVEDFWVWLQMSPHSVLIWYAERSLRGFGASGQITLGETLLYLGGFPSVGAGSDSFMDVWASPAQITVAAFDSKVGLGEGSDDKVLAPCSNCEEGNLSSVDVGVISSIRAESFSAALDWYPNECQYIDLYAFMQAELHGLLFDGILELLPPDRPARVIDVLGSISDNDDALIRLAERISCVLISREHDLQKEVKIRAISTFIPEILSSSETEQNLAVSAMVALSRLASILNVDFNQNIQALELVSGSKINGIWRGTVVDSDSLAIQRNRGWDRERVLQPGDHAVLVNGGLSELQLNSFVQSLYSIAEQTKALDRSPLLAVELEPGPLSLVHDLASLRKLVEELDRRGQSMQRVGLSLDLSHWILAGIKPCYLDRKILRRVVLAHLNDHSTGHFGDVIFDSLSPSENLKWKQVFKAIVSIQKCCCHGDLSLFTNYVSVELEASISKEAVDRAFAAVKHYFS